MEENKNEKTHYLYPSSDRYAVRSKLRQRTFANNPPPQNGDVTSGSIESEKTEADLYPLEVKNLDGFNLRFYNFDPAHLSWALNTLDAAEENGDNVNDAIYKRNRKIEDMYNCKITVDEVEDTASGFRTAVFSNDDLFDIAMIVDEKVASIYCEGLSSTWDILPYVDLDRSWWNKSASDTFSIKGNQYAAVGDYSLSMVTRNFVTLFNKSMIEDANLNDNLYDLVRDGKWTLDKLIEIEKQFSRDLNGDGVLDGNDQWAVSGAVKLYFGSLITGAGVKYISTDKDGNPYFAIPNNEFAIDVFQKVFNLHKGENIYYKMSSDVHAGTNESRDMFKNGQLAFQGTALKSIDQYRDANFDIGILPYPKYNEEQGNYYTLVSNGAVSVIPKTLPEDRAENVSIILEALARDSHYNLIPTYREVVLKTKYTRDDDSADMLDIIFQSSVFDLGLSVFPSETYYKYMECYLNMNDNFASLTATLESQVQNKIDGLLKAIEENVD
ncbi:MAG: hypothetical protein HFE63_04030 [Clostridiales bacterium]|nr:hypothetical protein [Clostridiales bacterium]